MTGQSFQPEAIELLMLNDDNILVAGGTDNAGHFKAGNVSLRTDKKEFMIGSARMSHGYRKREFQSPFALMLVICLIHFYSLIFHIDGLHFWQIRILV